MLHAAAEFRGGFIDNATEAAVEMGQALKADIVSYFCDAGGGLHEHALGLFYSGAVHEIREGQSGGAFE